MQTLGSIASPAKPNRLQRWLAVDPRKRPQVYTQVYASTNIGNLSYWLGIVFSAGIATFGLVQNSPAVIIGAMLISPLMGRIMATGLGLAVGDFYLALKAIANLVLSITLAVLLSALLVWLLPFHDATSEILARTNPNLLDLGIALISGLAGSVVVSRVGAADGLTALPGVAIAVALMPPLCTLGFGLGSGWNIRIMGGAGLLFITNLVSIVTSAFLVFLLIGMNPAELVAEIDRCREGEFLAEILKERRAASVFMHTGRLRWRFLALILLLGAVAIPLKEAFVQVTAETLARSAVHQEVQSLLPPGALVSQQVEVGRSSIAVRLFATQAVPSARVRQAEQAIEARSHKSTAISLTTVASQSELAQMQERLNAAPAAPVLPSPPPAQPIEDIGAQLITRITPALTDVWPKEAPLTRFDVALSKEAISLNVEYEAKRPLTPIALDLITNQLRSRLSLPALVLNAKRVAHASPAAKHAKR